MPEARILIWDNKSDQDMVDFLKSLKTPFVSGIEFSKSNIGWGTAVNRMIGWLKYWPADYVLISNNDVEYKDGWFEKLVDLYEKYPNIGIMGVWKHTSHGVRIDHGDLVEKDDMPAVGWLMKRSVLDDIGVFPEKGPCSTKGGNGEDSHYVNLAREKGYWVAAPKEDVATHIDGY